MRDAIYYAVLVPMVYAACAILVAGMLYKIIQVIISPRIKGTLGVFPQKLPGPVGVVKDSFLVPVAFRKDKLFWIFILAFHISFLLLILGHLELIREFALIQLVPHEVFLGAGFVGIVLILSTLYFLFRRFRAPWSEISVPEDFILLLILFITMIFGSHMHIAARYGIAGFDIPLDDYRTYLSSLVEFKPVIPDGILYSPHYIIIVIHIFFANLFAMIFPFSKMIHSVFTFFSHSLARKQ